MKHYIEITRQAFFAITLSDVCKVDCEQQIINDVLHTFYNSKGCNLLMIEQSTSPAQYYIQDVNA